MTSKLLNLKSYLTRPLGSAGCWATRPSWSISFNGLPLQWPALQLLCWLVITVQLHIHIPTALLCSPLGDLTQIYKYHLRFHNSVFYICGPAYSWTLGYSLFLLRCLGHLSQSLRTDFTLDLPSSSNLLLLASRVLGNSNPTIQGAKAQNISIPSLNHTTSQWPSLLALPLNDPEANHVTPSPVFGSLIYHHLSITWLLGCTWISLPQARHPLKAKSKTLRIQSHPAFPILLTPSPSILPLTSYPTSLVSGLELLHLPYLCSYSSLLHAFRILLYLPAQILLTPLTCFISFISHITYFHVYYLSPSLEWW